MHYGGRAAPLFVEHALLALALGVGDQVVRQAIAKIVAMSETEAPADRQRLEEAFTAACRMLGLEPS